VAAEAEEADRTVRLVKSEKKATLMMAAITTMAT
jgi:hypothetical protein